MSITAKPVAEFSSIPLQAKLRAAMRGGTFRAAWRLSDGREVRLTKRRCHVAETRGGKLYSAAFPSSAGAGLAVQCVLACAPGTDPFKGQALDAGITS